MPRGGREGKFRLIVTLTNLVGEEKKTVEFKAQ